MNAMVNPGAITATSLVAGDDADAIFESVRANLSAFAGRELDLDQRSASRSSRRTSATERSAP